MKRAFCKWRTPTSRAQTGIRRVRRSPRGNRKRESLRSGAMADQIILRRMGRIALHKGEVEGSGWAIDV